MVGVLHGTGKAVRVTTSKCVCRKSGSHGRKSVGSCYASREVAVYHFTIHAYRSWRPDHPRGYTRKGEGYQRPDKDVADEYDNAAKQPPVVFDRPLQVEILNLARSICEEEGWLLEAAGFDPTHTHLLISWRPFIEWEHVDKRLKNLLSLKLNRRRGIRGKRWFVRRHSAPRRVRDRGHLNYLVETYLPDHPGIFWKRGMTLPEVGPLG